MGNNPLETAREIEQTRDELGRKVDVLIDRSKVEAAEVGKKVAIGLAALAALIAVGMIAKARVRD
ncbi:MAG TPA: DUF3618 domain-containing protein [Actinomycetota bacterium]|jgi:hypothetical protein|nr:DUF3618 domain-containing protein [Actinomycetota bacterium]